MIGIQFQRELGSQLNIGERKFGEESWLSQGCQTLTSSFKTQRIPSKSLPHLLRLISLIASQGYTSTIFNTFGPDRHTLFETSTLEHILVLTSRAIKALLSAHSSYLALPRISRPLQSMAYV